LYDTKVAYNGSNINGGVLDPLNIVELDMTEFHTFRITVDQNAATVYKLFIDNNPAPAIATNDWWFDAGGFDTLVFGDISTGGETGKSEWDFLSWTPNDAIPIAGPASDVDGDGDVDGRDFLILQRTNPAGIPLWQTEYGFPGGGLSAVAVVPEPSGLLLVGISLLLMTSRRCRR
jgi:hypothetical protein